MQQIDEYLERRGAKYFVTLTVICYVLGTMVFNIYLYSLNIYEFEFLKLRFTFVGLMFVVMTAVLPLVYFGLKKWLQARKSAENAEKPRWNSVVEVALYVLFVPWVGFYSLVIFPTIPAAFGGGKPEIARLFGDPDTIQQLNEVIAYETGVDPDDLPFELTGRNGKLAVGANVKILDRNSSRFILILTKDLYLSSTSNVAKELLDSGEVKTFDDNDFGLDFEPRPVYFSAENIRGTTSTLYEPAKVTTNADIRVATEFLASSPQKAMVIEAVIAQDLPDAAAQIIQAVQKKVAEKNQDQPVSGKDTPIEIDEGDISDILETSGNQIFIGFRSDVFQQAGRLFAQEKTQIQSIQGRLGLAAAIKKGFVENFAIEWSQFSGDGNYLIKGQNETDWPRKIQTVFQGAESARVVIDRLNESVVAMDNIFPEVMMNVRALLVSSDQTNTEINRKFVSEVLVKHLNQKARQFSSFWSDPKYLYSGVRDNSYFVNLETAFATAINWRDLQDKLTVYQADFVIRVPAEPEPVEVEPVEEVLIPEEEETEPVVATSETSEESTETEAAATEETPATTETTTSEESPATTEETVPAVDENNAENL